MSRHFEITVFVFDLTSNEADALFDRVADAAHALDEQAACHGQWRNDDETT